MNQSLLQVGIVNRSANDLPAYETQGSAGMDLRADLSAPMTLQPGERALVPTGLHIELPQGYEAQVRARSGLAVKHGIGLVNAPGTIDSDYRGEVQVILINLGDKPFVVRRGERIAQMIVAAHAEVKIKAVGELSETGRGAGGFGSTGQAAAPSPRAAKKTSVPAGAARSSRRKPGTRA